ncbi:MAG: hypothetical protein ACJ8H8_05810 [Geminicoccaceae bacterium]
MTYSTPLSVSTLAVAALLRPAPAGPTSRATARGALAGAQDPVVTVPDDPRLALQAAITRTVTASEPRAWPA